jgi:tryptophan-rich sensory protein
MSETALHPRPSPGRAVAGLAVFTVAVVLVATIGGLAATSSAAQYQTLDLPTWAPPAAVFGLVWTVL